MDGWMHACILESKKTKPSTMECRIRIQSVLNTYTNGIIYCECGNNSINSLKIWIFTQIENMY